MEHQLNNPLRPSVKPLRTESPNPDVSTASKPPKEVKVSSTPPASTHGHLPRSPQPEQKPTHSTSTEEHKHDLKPEVRKALDDLNASEELRKLMLQLTQSGIEIAGPKKTYVKHSYEIDQEFHQRFHEM